MPSDTATNFGSTAFYKRCVTSFSGINSKTYTADTSCETKYQPDECGNNINVYTRNVKSNHDFEGEIIGGGPSGLCLTHVGHGVADPGLFLGNMANTGSAFICTRGRYTENAGDYAKFAATIENNDGV